MKKLVIFSFLLLGFSMGCKKDTIIVPPVDNPTTEFVYRSITGMVVDENSNPLPNTDVILDNKTTQTDQNGFFQFKSVSVPTSGAYIKALKAGYFHGSRTVIPGNGISQIRIMLMEKEIIGSVQTSAGGTVSTNGGAKVTLPTGDLVDASGATYSGEVQVAAKWIDPTTLEGTMQMPGDLRAASLSNEERILASFGMMAVELQSASGQELQPAPGRPATLEMPVPTELIGNAPAQIPLWYFDEDLGVWIEDGEAFLIGDIYQGQVTHFSFWNCDAPFPVINATGCIVDRQGQPVTQGVYVNIIVESSGLLGTGYLDTDGCFEGKIPKGELLTLELIGPCNDVIYEAQIGPFDNDVDLGVIQIADLDGAVVFGSIEDCLSAPVSDGFVIVKLAGLNYVFVTDQNGNFSGTFPYCENTSLTVTPYNTTTAEAGIAEVINLELNNDLGLLTACGEQLEAPFFLLRINGQEYLNLGENMEGDLGYGMISHAHKSDSVFQGVIIPITVISGFLESPSAYYNFYLKLPTQTVGNDLPEAEISMSGNTTDIGQFGFSGIYNFTNLDVLEFGPSGTGEIRVEFEVTIPAGGEVPIELELIGTLVTTVQ